MRLIAFPRVCLALLICALQTSAQTDFEFKDLRLDRNAEREALLTPPPVGVPGQKIAADFARLERGWLERAVFAPFRERAKGKSWEKEALSFVSAALDAWWPLSAYDFDETLAPRGRKLAKECDDPLVRYLAARVEYFCSYDRFWHLLRTKDVQGLWKADCLAYLGESEAALDHLSEIGPPALLRLIAIHAAAVAYEAHQRDRAEELYRARTVLTPKAVEKGGGYQLPEDEAVLIGHFLREPYCRRAGDPIPGLREIVETVPLSEWAHLTLLGICDWGDRTRTRSQKHPEESLAFKKERDTRWLKAWELNPSRPEIPATFFRFALEGGSPDASSPRLWFERAVGAELDHDDAYYRALRALRSGGFEHSHTAQSVQFARACAATGRWDTSAPFTLLDALKAAAKSKQWREFAREPETAAALVAMGEALVDPPSRVADASRWRSLQAVWAWVGGEDQLAERLLANLPGGELHTAAVHELRSFGASPAEMRAEVAARASDARAEYDRGEELFEKGRPAEARAAYGRALALAPPGGHAAAWLQGRCDAADFEVALEKGEWLKLPTSLEAWDVRAGHWSNSPDGALVLEGDDRPALIFFRGRALHDCEFRGEFTFSPSLDPIIRANVGVAFRGGGRTNYFLQCLVRESGADRLKTLLQMGFYDFRISKQFPAYPPEGNSHREPANRFHLRTSEERVSFSLNGKPVLQDVHCEVRLERPETKIGFASRSLPAGRTVTFRNLEVRQPKPASPARE